MILTGDLLHEFDKTYGDSCGFRYQGTKDNGRPYYVLNSSGSSQWSVRVNRTHHVLAFLYGRFSELYVRGDVDALSDEWADRTLTAYRRDPNVWDEWEDKGRESV